MLAEPDDRSPDDSTPGDTADRSPDPDRGFLPSRPERRGSESLLVRLVATAGIVGIGTALAAILGASDVEPWITGLVVALISVLLAAVLWRSRTL
jgi:hypothetical protein